MVVAPTPPSKNEVKISLICCRHLVLVMSFGVCSDHWWSHSSDVCLWTDKRKLNSSEKSKHKQKWTWWERPQRQKPCLRRFYSTCTCTHLLTQRGGTYEIMWLHFLMLMDCLSVCVSVHLSVFVSFCESLCLSVCLSVCLPVCLSICPSVCLSVCPEKIKLLNKVKPKWKILSCIFSIWTFFIFHSIAELFLFPHRTLLLSWRFCLNSRESLGKPLCL